MTQNLVVRVANRLRASWCWLLSFGKRDWELNDYPVSIRTQDPEREPVFRASRFKHHRYVARIVNWWVLDGSGDTKEEAIRSLADRFANAKAGYAKNGKPLPRPGTQVPIEFAVQDQTLGHPELADDFIHRILGLEWAWISDESSLWHFHQDETNDRYYAKIRDVYGVDVSDIESARLWEIFDRIASEHARVR